jgi:rubredoxin
MKSILYQCNVCGAKDWNEMTSFKFGDKDQDLCQPCTFKIAEAVGEAMEKIQAEVKAEKK